MSFGPRKTPMPPRRESLKRSPIKPKKRKPSEFARIYGSKKRVEFVKSLPCVFCHRSPCENAHIENGGMGRKADYDKIIPACAFCHNEMHQWGAESYAAIGDVDLSAAAARTEAAWQATQEPNDA